MLKMSDWADCPVKCLSRATRQIPKSNVCAAQLGRFPGQMSVLCKWVERPHDGMIMENKDKVKSYGCVVPRSSVSLVQLGRAATWQAQPPGTHIHTPETDSGFCTHNATHTKKEPTHVSKIAQKRLVNSVFICIDLNVIQTSPSCLRHSKSLDKKLRLRLCFLSRSLNPVNTRDSVCII